jgi:CheY-like chemotaxis protein
VVAKALPRSTNVSKRTLPFPPARLRFPSRPKTEALFRVDVPHDALDVFRLGTAVPLNLLIVDDDEDMTALLMGVLSSDGHTVCMAHDGEVALSLTRSQRFDLVLTDVNLPVLSGLELFEKLRAETPGVEVIVMTADAAIKDAVTALREGAADYLAKPFDMNELRLRIRRIGERVRLRRQLDATLAAWKERLGSYVLEAQIGEGSMGVVYRASHVMLRRPTAVKLLLRTTTPMAIERFEREVQLSCRLTHPNTIAIYDYGRTPEGVFYYAMELLNGASLFTVVKTHGAFGASRVLRVLDHLCGSLAEAHAHGLIHRDVKPSNIQLCERGGIYDTTKLLDFGLVKEVASEETVHATKEHVILGTPSYMAPEVIRDANATSPAQDIYALGAVAYYMLTGVNAFFAQRPMDVYLQQLTATPMSFNKRGIKVPRKLAALVAACLEKKPENRPQSASELRRAVLTLRQTHQWSDEHAEQWWHAQVVTQSAQDLGCGRTVVHRERKRAAHAFG